MEAPMKDQRGLKTLMRATAVVIGVGLGLSHLLFPAKYFTILGQGNYDAGDPFHSFLANVAGALLIALCVGLWIAASDPVKNRVVIVMFLVACVLIVPVFLYHLVFTRAVGGMEWLNPLAVGALAWVFWKWRPWKNSP
jgi:hypothetical protein